MAKLKVVLDRFVKKDGSFPLKLSISHKAETTFIPFNIDLTKEQWNGSEVINRSDSKSLNRVIRTKVVQAEAILLNLSAKMNNISIKELRYFIQSNNTTPEPIPECKIEDQFQKYIFHLTNLRTKEIYQETLNKIKKFRTGSTLSEVSASWLREFDTFLSSTCGINTRAIHMRNIRAVFNAAIDEDIIPLNSYPFRKFKIKKEKTIKRSLIVDQIKQIRDYQVQDHQEKYRDIFMLIFYLIGINIVDLLRLRPGDLNNGRIEYRRAKTGRLYSIEVLPEALEIIERYRGKDHLLDIMDTYTNYKDFAARMNENLKEIGVLEWVPNEAKNEKFVKKNKKKITPLFPTISTYYARHSWATIAASLDIPKETIAASLGHGGNNDTTDVYIDFDLKKIDKANRDVIKAIL